MFPEEIHLVTVERVGDSKTENPKHYPKRDLVVYEKKENVEQQTTTFEKVHSIRFDKKDIKVKTADMFLIRGSELMVTFPSCQSIFYTTLTEPYSEMRITKRKLAPAEGQTEGQVRLKRVWVNRYLKQIVISFYDETVRLYDLDLRPLRFFNFADVEPPSAAGQHPGLWKRHVTLNTVNVCAMQLVVTSGCLYLGDPDGVDDEARHGVFWFDWTTDKVLLPLPPTSSAPFSLPMHLCSYMLCAKENAITCIYDSM